MEPPSPIWALGVNHFPSIFINLLGKGLTQEVNACAWWLRAGDAKVSWFVKYVFHPLNLNLGTILNHYFKCFLRLFGRDNARMSRHAVVQRIQPRVKCSTINSACSSITIELGLKSLFRLFRDIKRVISRAKEADYFPSAEVVIRYLELIKQLYRKRSRIANDLQILISLSKAPLKQWLADFVKKHHFKITPSSFKLVTVAQQ